MARFTDSPTSPAIRALVSGLVLAGLLLGLADTAEARRRRSRGSSKAAAEAMKKKMYESAQAQVAAGQQLLAAAQMKGNYAQGNFQAALAKVQQAAAQHDAAQDSFRELAKQLAELEEDILNEQSADSPYALAQLEFGKAKRELAAVEKRLLADPALQSQLSGQDGGPPPLKSVVLAGEFEYIQAKAVFDLAAKEVERIRRELFRTDEDWKAGAEALTEARQEQSDSAKGTQNVSRLGPLKEIKDAQQAAVIAQRMISQGQAQLKSINYKPSSKSSSKKK